MRIGLLLALLTALACGDDSTPETDAGRDSGDMEDGGGIDSATDTGGVDSGGIDGGMVDSGDTDGGGGTEFTMHDFESFPPRCCGHETNIEIASDGAPRILSHAQNGGVRRVSYVVRNGDMWEATNVTEDAALPRPFSERSALALDADDDPHALFAIGDGTLHYLWFDGTWQAIPIGDSDVGNLFTHFDIAIDSSGAAHVVWFDRTTLALRYGAYNGSTFDIETVDTPEVDDQNGEYARIAIAADDTIHISYLAIVSDTAVLRHASGTAGSWTTEDVPGEGKGVHGSMLIDSTGNLHIVSTGLVSSRADGLYWSRHDGSSWSETMLADPADSRFADVDAVLDSADRAWVIGARSVSGLGYPVLYYPLGAERANYHMRSTAVGNVPESVGIALDASDTPHVVGFNYGTLM